LLFFKEICSSGCRKKPGKGGGKGSLLKQRDSLLTGGKKKPVRGRVAKKAEKVSNNPHPGQGLQKWGGQKGAKVEDQE